jgi:phosphonate transport system substrate-binding protein
MLRLTDRVALLCLLCCAILCIISSTTAAQTTQPTTAVPMTDRSGWPEKIRFGIVPTEGGADTHQRYLPIQEHLSRELKVPVEVMSTSSYQGIITAMGNDQLEFAYMGPKSYIEAARRSKAQALVVELSKDKARGYYSVFIVPRNSTLQTIRDAKGKRFAFTDPNSTSGRVVPAAILFDQLGVSAEAFFSKVTYSGSHGTSILQVAQGELDLAATNDMDLNRMIEKGAVKQGDVRIIYTSDLIPGAPVAARGDIPDTLKEAFVQAMLKLNDDAAVLEQLQCGGYARVQDAEYDIVRVTDVFVREQESKK